MGNKMYKILNFSGFYFYDHDCLMTQFSKLNKGESADGRLAIYFFVFYSAKSGKKSTFTGLWSGFPKQSQCYQNIKLHSTNRQQGPITQDNSDRINWTWRSQTGAYI